MLARELRREGCGVILCQEYEHARFDMCVLMGQLMHLPVFATFQGGDTQLAQIFNPIDVALWRASDRGEARAAFDIRMSARVVVWHGRILLQRKRLNVLLDAWDRVCRERPARDLRLLLVGTGNDANELRRRIADKALSGLLWVDKFVHDCTAIRRYLSAADVYVSPSRHEGFPVAPIEALSCSLPVVTADAPGVLDILEGGEASGGLVVPRGDAAALALALGRILDDEVWCRELGQRARCRAEICFSLEAVGGQLRTFLSSRGGGTLRPRSVNRGHHVGNS